MVHTKFWNRTGEYFGWWFFNRFSFLSGTIQLFKTDLHVFPPTCLYHYTHAYNISGVYSPNGCRLYMVRVLSPTIQSCLLPGTLMVIIFLSWEKCVARGDKHLTNLNWEIWPAMKCWLWHMFNLVFYKIRYYGAIMRNKNSIHVMWF